MTPAALTPEQYLIEREVCARADAYWKAHATYGRGGWSSMSAELAAHPDYAACDNAMRGRVEQYEILTAPPAKLSAYVSSDGVTLTTWAGDVLGQVYLGCGWRVHSHIGSRMYQAFAWIDGREYTGRTYGKGMLVNLRLTAAAQRAA